MLFGIFLAIAFGVILAVVVRAAPGGRQRAVLGLLLGGYALRIVVSLLVRETAFFSHAAGGDSQLYEEWALLITKLWSVRGIHFVDADELPVLGATTLPPNLFALVFYAGGEDARLGCVALVAIATALAFLNMYTLSIELGAEERQAFLLMALLYLSPLVLFYTCDTYKDGLVVCFTMGALASSIRLSRRFSVLHAIIGVVNVFALWYVRFYLVFVVTAPLAVGLVGVGSKSVLRPMLVALASLVVVLALASFTNILQSTVERASETFERGTSHSVTAANASGGSGVTFDDGGNPFGAIGSKLAYTIFSPFPWAAGSFGFQIGKLDAFLWYWVLYRAVRAARQIWRTQATVVVMLLTFLVPSTFMYATGMSNIGLIVRQRLAIVFATAVLASLYSPRRGERVGAAPEAAATDPQQPSAPTEPMESA